MPQEDGDAWNVKDFEPYFAEVWRLFGPGRMAFGGNWCVAGEKDDWLSKVTRSAREAVGCVARAFCVSAAD